MYQSTGDAALARRRCGISRQTLRKWVKRYEKQGLQGQQDRSMRMKHSPNRKVFASKSSGY